VDEEAIALAGLQSQRNKQTNKQQQLKLVKI
jgi:hypothetical protein